MKKEENIITYLYNIHNNLFLYLVSINILDETYNKNIRKINQDFINLQKEIVFKSKNILENFSNIYSKLKTIIENYIQFKIINKQQPVESLQKYTQQPIPILNYQNLQPLYISDIPQSLQKYIPLYQQQYQSLQQFLQSQQTLQQSQQQFLQPQQQILQPSQSLFGGKYEINKKKYLMLKNLL